MYVEGRLTLAVEREEASEVVEQTEAPVVKAAGAEAAPITLHLAARDCAVGMQPTALGY